jgi:hypothetical protein
MGAPRTVGPHVKYAVVDVANNSTTVCVNPCRVWGIFVNTVLSAHALPIQDNTTAVITLAASTAANTNIVLPGIYFATSLIVDPNDAATGNITVMYEEDP